MIEKIIVLEEVDPVLFYGVNNSNIQLLKSLFPKIRLVARGNVLKVLGDEEEMCAFEEAVIAIEKYCSTYNIIDEDVVNKELSLATKVVSHKIENDIIPIIQESKALANDPQTIAWILRGEDEAGLRRP